MPPPQPDPEGEQEVTNSLLHAARKNADRAAGNCDGRDAEGYARAALASVQGYATLTKSKDRKS